MNVKIVQLTSKGQITLPKQWRDNNNITYVIVETTENLITVRPYQISLQEDAKPAFLKLDMKRKKKPMKRLK